MTRSAVSVAMAAQLNALSSRPGHLFEVYFDDETVYMTDFFTTIPWNGQSYINGGHALSYDGVEENVEMQAKLARIVLSAADDEWIPRILAKNYINRRLVIRKAVMDASWTVVVDPVVEFDGLMKKPQILVDEDTGDSKAIISASHDASDINNQSGRRTNDQVQRIFFPNDGIFKYASQADRTIVWGGGVSQQQVATQVADSAASAPARTTGDGSGDAGGF